MATLLETLQKRLAGQGVQQTAPNVAPAINIEEVLKAKTGKAVQPGVQQSNVLQSITEESGQEQLKQQTQAGQLQAAQLGQQVQQLADTQKLAKEGLAAQNTQAQAGLTAQTQMQRTETQAAEQRAKVQRQAAEASKVAEMNNRATLALQQLTADRNLSRDQLFSDAKIDNKELAARKDSADLEQKAFLLAMQDRDYLDELNRIGVERNLTSKIEFDKQLADIVYGQNMASMLDDFGFTAAQKAKDRKISLDIARLGGNQIVDLARANAEQSNRRAAWEGVGKAASTAADYWAKQETPAKPATPATPEEVIS